MNEQQDQSPAVMDGIQEINGRMYVVKMLPDFAGAATGTPIIVGPPEGLVDSLGLSREQADRMHQILFDRRIFTFKDIARGQTAQAIMQEILQLDSQKLVEAFYKNEEEPVTGG